MDKKTDEAPKEGLMHSFKNEDNSFPMKPTIILVLIIFFGIFSGYGLARMTAKSGKSVLPGGTTNSVSKGKIFGSDDTKTFSDKAEGVLKKGGIEGEGQYHLEREGGESQNVYLTSSLVDMSQFVNKKIKVWGQTQKAQTAGWLMDVGRVEVLD